MFIDFLNCVLPSSPSAPDVAVVPSRDCCDGSSSTSVYTASLVGTVTTALSSARHQNPDQFQRLHQSQATTSFSSSSSVVVPVVENHHNQQNHCQNDVDSTNAAEVINLSMLCLDQFLHQKQTKKNVTISDAQHQIKLETEETKRDENNSENKNKNAKNRLKKNPSDKFKDNTTEKKKLEHSIGKVDLESVAVTIQESKVSQEDVVTPWTVSAGAATGVDYDKLIEKFGCRKISSEQLKRLEDLTGRKTHVMLRRGLFFAQRDFDRLLDRLEQKKPFYLYTGRGPSSGSLHLGHLVPFMFARSLQEQLQVPLIIQITDDEKFLWKDMSLAEVKKIAIENVKDIIAVGFDPARTFIFFNTEYICPAFYENILKIWRSVTNNQARAIFGFTGEDSIGKSAFPAIEAAPCFSSSFPQIFGGRKDIPCLIPCAIDQDPFFRMTRDVAPRLGYPKPSLLYSSFLPALQGAQSKMAASDANTCIYINDTPKQIKNKINKYAFSGGQATIEEHRRLGGDPEVDTAFQFLRFFLEDDAELEQLARDYRSGQLLSGELKARAVEVVQGVVAEVQKRRKGLTDADVEAFTQVRKLSAFPSF